MFLLSYCFSHDSESGVPRHCWTDGLCFCLWFHIWRLCHQHYHNPQEDLWGSWFCPGTGSVLMCSSIHHWSCHSRYVQFIRIKPQNIWMVKTMQVPSMIIGRVTLWDTIPWEVLSSSLPSSSSASHSLKDGGNKVQNKEMKSCKIYNVLKIISFYIWFYDYILLFFIFWYSIVLMTIQSWLEIVVLQSLDQRHLVLKHLVSWRIP